MDSAQNKIARLERSIARTGESVVIERLNTDPNTGASEIVKSVSVPAWIRSSHPQDLLDNEARNIRLVIGPTEILAPTAGSPPEAFGLPQRDDRIILQGFVGNLEQIAPIYYGGVLVRINMVARG